MGVIIKHGTKKYIMNKLSLYAQSPERLDPGWKSVIDAVIDNYKKEEERISRMTSVATYINMRYKEKREHVYISDKIYCDKISSFRYNDALITNIVIVAVDRGLMRINI